MKPKIRFILFLFSMTCSLLAIAQKPVVDEKAIESWPSFNNDEATINSSGQYVSYTISNSPVGKHTLVVTSVDLKWKRQWIGGASEFSPSGRYVLIKKGTDSLGVIELGSLKETWYVGISSFNSSPLLDIIVYPQRGMGDSLVTHRLMDGKLKSYARVKQFLFSPDGKNLLIQRDIEEAGDRTGELLLVDLEKGREKSIWKGDILGSLVFNARGGKLSFLGSKNGSVGVAVWSYDHFSGIVRELFSGREVQARTGLNIDGISGFCENQEDLVLSLREEKGQPKLPTIAKQGVPVIWSVRDESLPLKYPPKKAAHRTFKALLLVAKKEVLQLERDGLTASKLGSNWWLVYKKSGGYSGEQHWNERARDGFEYLISEDGKMIRLEGVGDLRFMEISPDGGYVVYFSLKDRTFCSLDLSSGKSRVISSGLSFSPFGGTDKAFATYHRSGYFYWQKGTAKVYVYDHNDLWLLDCRGITVPVNLTKGEGKRNGIVFSVLIQSKKNVFAPDQQLLLTAFNERTKANGFYRLSTKGAARLEQLTMEDKYYYTREFEMNGIHVTPPLKASNAEVYLVRRMEASSAPNYFVTHDFRKFDQLTQLYPEKGYNWMSSELLNWTLPGGQNGQALIYKPENFDPLKKYPVLFYFYEEMTNEMHHYRYPALSEGPINIPWMVSRGYIVCTPDIFYEVGNPGVSAMRFVNSAADQVAKLPYVDSTKMALQGHSFGGYEVNYILTKTNRFAAAITAAGVSDLVSQYNATWDAGNSKQPSLEFGQYHMGSSLWESRNNYLANSPILNADKVNTPLLIMHNRLDTSVEFGQGLAWFTALRRLKKEVWMLEYPKPNSHLIKDRLAQRDYTDRMCEFLDFYLKGSKEPKWLGMP